MPVAQSRADPVTVHRWTERGESPSDQKLDHRLEHSYQEDKHLDNYPYPSNHVDNTKAELIPDT